MSKKLFATRLPRNIISKVKLLAELEGISQAVLTEKAFGMYLSSKLRLEKELVAKKEHVIQKESNEL